MTLSELQKKINAAVELGLGECDVKISVGDYGENDVDLDSVKVDTESSLIVFNPSNTLSFA